MTDVVKEFDCLKATQNDGSFYLFVAPAKEVIDFLTVKRRGLTEAEQERVQRALDVKRQKEIAEYLLQEDATFPTSITVNADSDYIHAVSEDGRLKLIFGQEVPTAEGNVKVVHDGAKERFFAPVPEGRTPAEIVDGQHRFEGLRMALKNADSAERKKALNDFEIPFAVMLDLTPEDCARVFVIINSTQRKVDKSHIADLFGLSSRRTMQRTSHLIAKAVNKMEGGPFYRGLKMLGKRVEATEYLSQGSFVKYLLKLMSSDPEADERTLLNNEPLKPNSALPFRSLFEKNQDSRMLEIVIDYFSAVRDIYPVAWSESPDKYLLRKTVGFSATASLLKRIAVTAQQWAKGDDSRFDQIMSAETFRQIMEAVKQGIPESEWASGKFSSSEAEASKMTARMAEHALPKLDELLKDVPV